MKVADIMTSKVITAGAEDSLSKAVNLMVKHRVHQLPVFDGKNLLGIIDLKNVVTRNVDVSTARARTFVEKVPSISSAEDAEKAAELLMQTGIRALPVVDDGKLAGIVSEADLMKIFRKSGSVAEIMAPCKYAENGWKIGDAENILRNSNISRVPVVRKGKVVGVVSTLDMAKVSLSQKTIEARGGRLQEKGVKEKTKPEHMPVESIMSAPSLLPASASLNDAAKALLEAEEVFVEDGGNIYIITQKDMLELLTRKKTGGVYVQITNLGDELPIVASSIDRITTEFVQASGMRVKRPEALSIYIERHHKQGTKIKYSVRARFITASGIFVSHAWGWELIAVMHDALAKIEHEIGHKMGKKGAHKQSGKKKGPRY